MCISRANSVTWLCLLLTGVTDHIVLCHSPGQSPNVHYPKTPFFRDSFICPHRILLFTKIETNSQYLFLWIIQTYAPTYTYIFFMYCWNKTALQLRALTRRTPIALTNLLTQAFKSKLSEIQRQESFLILLLLGIQVISMVTWKGTTGQHFHLFTSF